MDEKNKALKGLGLDSRRIYKKAWREKSIINLYPISKSYIKILYWDQDQDRGQGFYLYQTLENIEKIKLSCRKYTNKLLIDNSCYFHSQRAGCIVSYFHQLLAIY